jgi:two-component system, cell cycle response regulator
MSNGIINILLVEDNPGDARLIRELLLAEAGARSPDSLLQVYLVDRLSSGLERLVEGGIDVVLLDLSLPDSQGLETLMKVRAQSPQLPTVVLTGLANEEVAMQALQEGAQDYLIKGESDYSSILKRSMRYAIERQRLQAELHRLALTDELTGLYNRRAFIALADQQLKLARRTHTDLFLLFADVDGLKEINDTLGHREGDRALIEIASILRQSARESDIIARMGGDEFVILGAQGTGAGMSSLSGRIQTNLKAYNVRMDASYRLGISLGMASLDPDRPCTIDQLVDLADSLMYQQKRDNHGSKTQSSKWDSCANGLEEIRFDST